jgi:hypothetical protein
VASNSVPVAIGSRRIFAVPLDLAYLNLADVDAMAYARFAPEAVLRIIRAADSVRTIGGSRLSVSPGNVSRTLGWFDRDMTPKEIRKILRSFAMAAESQRQYASHSHPFA